MKSRNPTDSSWFHPPSSLYISQRNGFPLESARTREISPRMIFTSARSRRSQKSSWNPVKIYSSRDFLFSANLEDNNILICSEIEVLKRFLICKNRNPNLLFQVFTKFHVRKPFFPWSFCFWILPDSSCFWKRRIGEFDDFSLWSWWDMFLKVCFSIPWVKWEVINTEKECSFWKNCRIHIRMKWKEYDFRCWSWVVFYFWNNRNVFDCMSTFLEKSAHFHGIIGHYIPDCTNPTHEYTLEYPAHITVVINDIDEDIYWNSWKTSNLFVRLKIFSLIYKRVNSLRKFFSSLSFLFLKDFRAFYFHVVILLPLRKMQTNFDLPNILMIFLCSDIFLVLFSQSKAFLWLLKSVGQDLVLMFLHLRYFSRRLLSGIHSKYGFIIISQM